MIIGRVHGTVVSTTKSPKLAGLKLLLVVPIEIESFTEKGAPLCCVDTVGAGDGEVVLCVAGSSARQTAITDGKPVDGSIVAILDHVDYKGTRVFEK
ncbi:MAG: EutN/CcmL family microcompartment protein [Clostridiales bacterium]|nr:EutN/CcmL family microcompartment protein [Clostridiales bacterium]